SPERGDHGDEHDDDHVALESEAPDHRGSALPRVLLLPVAFGFDRSVWSAHLMTSVACRSAAALIASSFSSSPASTAVCRPWVMTITRSQTSASSPNSVVTHSTAMWFSVAAA